MSDYLWVEKYRPRKIEDCILSQDIKKLGQFLSQKYLIYFYQAQLVLVKLPLLMLCEKLGRSFKNINFFSIQWFQIDTLRNIKTKLASTVSLTEQSNHKVVIIWSRQIT